MDAPAPLRIVNDRAGIAKLWARERIAALARQKNLGGDATEAQSQIVGLALEHHLVSEYTSLVAVDETPVAAVGSSARQAQVPVVWHRAGRAWANTERRFAKTATPGVRLLTLDWPAWRSGIGLRVEIRNRRATAARIGSALRRTRSRIIAAPCGVGAIGHRLHHGGLLDPRKGVRRASADQRRMGSHSARRGECASLALGRHGAGRADDVRATATQLVVLEGSSGETSAFAPSHDAASVLPGEPATA